MRRIATLLTLLILGNALAVAQSFTIATSPRTAVLNKGKATFTITTEPKDGFDASVYLSLAIPDLPNATIALALAILNPPYTTGAVATITLAGVVPTGDYPVVVEAGNGPLLLRDTVTLRVVAPPGWRLYNTGNSQIPSNYVTDIVLDRNGVAWISTLRETSYDRRNITRFDGTTWETVVTVPGYPDDTLALPIADSTGGVWFTIPSGLAHVDAAGKWSRFAPESSPFMPADTVEAKAVGPNGQLWAYFGDTLARLDGDTWTRVPGAPGCSRCLMAIDTAKRIWVTHRRDLIRFDGTFTTTYTSRDLTGTGVEGLQQLLIEPGYVWALSYKTLALISAKGVTIYQAGFYPQAIAKGPSVSSSNPPKNIWIALGISPVDGGGVARDASSITPVYNVTNSGLPSDDIRTIAIGRDGIFWFGTYKGLATYDSRIQAGAEQDDRNLSRRSIMRLAPNPLHGSGTLTLDISERGRVSVDVLSTLGEQIAAVIDETLDAGTRTIPFDASALPNGMYFVRLTTDAGVEMVPIVVTR